MFGVAALLSACGVSSAPTAQQAATAVSSNEAGTAVSLAGTAVAAPEMGTAEAMAGTVVAAPEMGTAEAMAGDAITAAADDVTLQQGEALVLDASKSVGDIQDYKWTIVQAPTSATSVVGQVIGEGSSGNLSLNPDDYTKYFPASGDYTIRLTVMDAKGAASNDDFTISVP
jgi:hypothetical protein